MFKPGAPASSAVGTLGAASYALYLMHEPIMSVLTKIFGALSLENLLGATGFSLAEVTVAVTIAVIVSAMIERPLTRALRRHFIH
jgi:peptidoglycan/LPS O-acetylase OafA/YrhL